MCEHCKAKAQYTQILAAKVVELIQQTVEDGQPIPSPAEVKAVILKDVAQVCEDTFGLIAMAMVESGLADQHDANLPAPSDEAMGQATVAAEGKKGYKPN
jgi:hypothetical protein